jgi:hypothetical protein
MGVLDDLLNPQNSRAVRQIASQTGVGEADARSALEHLAPAISRGLQRNIGAEGGLDSLLRALQSGNHGRYLDDPGQLGNAVDDGNNILGHIFGSKDVSRGVANQVSQQTGIGADLLKQMLPLIASLVMGALAKNAGGGFGQQQGRPSDSGGGLGDILGSVLGGGQAQQSGGGLGDILGAALGGGGGAQQAAGGGLGSILSSMLDSNRDGSAFDDILDMATRGRR